MLDARKRIVAVAVSLRLETDVKLTVVCEDPETSVSRGAKAGEGPAMLRSLASGRADTDVGIDPSSESHERTADQRLLNLGTRGAPSQQVETTIDMIGRGAHVGILCDLFEPRRAGATNCGQTPTTDRRGGRAGGGSTDLSCGCGG